MAPSTCTVVLPASFEYFKFNGTHVQSSRHMSGSTHYNRDCTWTVIHNTGGKDRTMSSLGEVRESKAASDLIESKAEVRKAEGPS